MDVDFNQQATFDGAGNLVYLDGTPVPELGPWKVCENTLQLHLEARAAEPPRRRSLHEKALIRRRKRKRGGPH
jgi:hypothetical protein